MSRAGGASVRDDIRERYRRGADDLREHSAVHSRWAESASRDPVVLDLLARIPADRRQPSLFFSVCAFLGAPLGSWAALRAWMDEHSDQIVAESGQRRTQTNEAARCGPLAFALARIDGPIGLVEIGASAGLCLAVDRYSYRFHRPGGVELERLGDGSPHLDVVLSPGLPVPRRMSRIAERVGIDLDPLDPNRPDDAAWLEALIPPDRPDRLDRLRTAIALARREPSLTILRGDALDLLPAALSRLPRDATPVVACLGTAVYLAPSDRASLVPRAAELDARLVTLEGASVLPQVAARLPVSGVPPTRFVLALDGEPLAWSSAHGERMYPIQPVDDPGSTG